MNMFEKIAAGDIIDTASSAIRGVADTVKTRTGFDISGTNLTKNIPIAKNINVGLSANPVAKSIGAKLTARF